MFVVLCNLEIKHQGSTAEEATLQKPNQGAGTDVLHIIRS